ncbi:hypothetical protein FOXG_20528 [Fusarium oxysporum f. sp. lycopersici 4287]|uniref:Uncharacterized protein n=1 Tax=Fusarium oxysporum f. sp. lycopersici (strain 4287 / CBS 123668 / FGSC 9935 / NRRL 34936) TaxID=426428 RepID=A0A0J9VJZ4_FUSO4|nr:hypothetical protein FOXG_20528 [Fusarium oxysporum f. sp. lycopersici 4287]KNB11539.1 hypothetical protein FOXG_20528 [Fusarium oxysporum f. sp. lycopersici 4287]
MDFSNGVLSMCLLTFSTTVCVLGLILGVVFVLIHRQREEQLLDDIYHTVCSAIEASDDAENCNCVNGEQNKDQEIIGFQTILRSARIRKEQQQRNPPQQQQQEQQHHQRRRLSTHGGNTGSELMAGGGGLQSLKGEFGRVHKSDL